MANPPAADGEYPTPSLVINNEKVYGSAQLLPAVNRIIQPSNLILVPDTLVQR